MSVYRVVSKVYVKFPSGKKVVLTDKQYDYIPLLEHSEPNYWELSIFDRQCFDSMWKKELILYKSPSTDMRFLIKTIHLTDLGKQVLEEIKKVEK